MMIDITRQLDPYFQRVTHPYIVTNVGGVALGAPLPSTDRGRFMPHLHIADSEGLDEGVQIGEGEIDFPTFWEDLDRGDPNSSFISEIWQGHKNDEEGFGMAFGRLENCL